MDYVIVYIIIAAIVGIINTLIAGFNGKSYSKNDIKDSLLWPLSVSVLLGLLARLVFEKILDYKKRIKGKK